MKYRYYLAYRALQIIPTFLLISLFIFVVARVMPGDPARLVLGPEATESQILQLRHELGLDQPLPLQYVNFLKGLVRGDMGISLRTLHSVSSDIEKFFPATFELVTVTLAIAIPIGVLLGVISALNKGRAIDQLTRLFAISGVTLPRYVSGILLQIVIAYSLSLLPIFGRIDSNVSPITRITGLFILDSLLTLNFPAFVSSTVHIILPAFTLALSPICLITRLVRSSLIDELRKPHTLTMISNGLPRNLIVYKYALKNAFSATLTTIGVLYGHLLGGAFVVETVFSWPGMAYYGVQSALFKDLNAIVGVTLVMALVYLIVNFVVDVMYGHLDPRIRMRY